MFVFRALIQQLYLQVCNIGKNLRDDMNSKQQEHYILPFNQDFVKIVEKHLETFTKKQTVIIEKWSKLDKNQIFSSIVTLG